MNYFKEKLKETFYKRPIIFYVNLVAAILSIFSSIFYLCAYINTNISCFTFLLPFLGGLAFLIISFFGFEKYASMCLWLFDIAGFVFLGANIYLFFVDFFVNLTFNSTTIVLFISTALYLISWIFSFVCYCLSIKNRTDKEEKIK